MCCTHFGHALHAFWTCPTSGKKGHGGVLLQLYCEVLCLQGECSGPVSHTFQTHLTHILDTSCMWSRHANITLYLSCTVWKLRFVLFLGTSMNQVQGCFNFWFSQHYLCTIFSTFMKPCKSQSIKPHVWNYTYHNMYILSGVFKNINNSRMELQLLEIWLICSTTWPAKDITK